MNAGKSPPNILYYLLPLTLSLQVLFAIAQDKFPNPIRFPTLKFNDVYEIEQDDNNLLWLATNNGLFCFDGIVYRRIIHAPDSVSAIDNGQINHLFLDREEEKLWIASIAGASVLDLQTETFNDYTFYPKKQPDLTDGECESIFKDREGVLWFGITNLGLARLDKRKEPALRLFPLEKKSDFSEGNLRLYIYQIAQDVEEDATLWLATSITGLIRFNVNTGLYTIPDQKKIRHKLGVPAGGLIFTSLYPAKDKIFLGSMWSNHCVVYDLNTYSFRALDFKQPFRLPLTRYRSPGTFWNFHGPINIIDIEEERIIRSFSKPYEEEEVSNAFMENPDQFWLSSNKRLLLYDFSHYQVENHLLYDKKKEKPFMLRAVVEKEDGKGFWLFFQISDFLYEYDRESGVRRKTPWPEEHPVYPIHLQGGRFLFLGKKGFYELRDNQFKALPLFKNLFATNPEFTLPVQDENGFLWLSSRWSGLLYKMDLENEKYWDYGARYNIKGAVPIFKDEAGNIWMGGNGFVVYHAQKDTFYTFPFQPGKQKTVHYPRGFAQDSQGNVWTSDIRVGGLMKLNPNCLAEGVQERFIANSGSRNNQMQRPTLDQKGRIWTVTIDGLQVYYPKQDSFALHGGSAGFRLRTTNQTHDNFTPAYLTCLSSGEMLVGYKEGFAIFHPDSLQGNEERPKPYLLSLQAGERQLIQGHAFNFPKTFSLKYDENRISMEFSAVAWRESQKIRFAYRMKEVDDQWMETKQRSINYSNLSPGAYTFQLRALNSDGKELEEPLEACFEIAPPWWRSLWAYAFYLVSVLAAAYFFYDYKRKQWQLKAQLIMEQGEADRLKELNETKTRLYTNITHEFRTPITVILGMAEQARDNPETWFREGLRMIIRNGKNLLSLVNQMLDLSKLEVGALPVNLIQGDVVAYLKYIVESFHSYAEMKKVQLHFLCERETFHMDYDAEKLLNIVSNLLSNAIKYTPGKGKVYLSVEIGIANNKTQPAIENRILNSNGHRKETFEYFIIRVRDTGIGIPEDKLPFIFDRFYQAEESALRKTGGTGIGLAITKEFVKLLDGTIGVQSKLGEGVEFFVSLPVRRSAPLIASGETYRFKEELVSFIEAIPFQEEANSPKSGKQELPLLLIVEDNRDVIRYLSACLREDYRLTLAFNGKSGIAKALELIPDVVVSDVMMPEADGFEVCQTLKKNRLTSHIPIVLLTAKADVLSKIEGLERGADAYLAKPFNKEELLVRLRKLIELRRSLQEYYRSIPLPKVSQEPEITIENAFILEVQNILETNLGDEQFGVPELCKALGVSRAQLYRKFKALTGQTVARYFRSLRLHKAKSLLQTTDLNISEIAFETGFKDPAHFTHAFKEEFGENPSAARKV